MDRQQVVDALEEIATLLELTDDNPFKARAYHQGARTLERLSEDLDTVVAAGRLGDLPGFGDALVQKVTTLVQTGTLPYLEELRRAVPAGVREMLRVPGLGPKKVKLLHEELGLSSLGELEHACRENRLLLLSGFGEKSQAKVLAGIQFLKVARERRLLPEAESVAARVRARLAKVPGVKRVEAAGSLRRRRETIGDLDFVAAAREGEAAGAALASMKGVAEVLGQGPTKTSVRFEDGLQVDLRVVDPSCFGAALLYFTGNKDWNVALRGLAREKGYRLNEYGLFKLEGESGESLVPCADEKDILDVLGVADTPPELREDAAALQQALGGTLPELVAEKDVRGVLHAHTNWSDGADTLEAMAAAAEEAGLEYLGLSDHSQSAAYAHGLKPPDLARQHAELQAVQERHPRVKLFWGIESDILADGSLDYDDATLGRFDFVIASVHSSFGLSPADMTQRLVRAASHPCTRVMGHPTGRLLLAREGYRFDLDAVLDACAAHGVAIELNAHPHRLDLDWRDLPRARARGVPVAIDPDSHRKEDLSDWRWGIGIARKGWLRAADVLNTKDAKEMAAWLARRP